MNDLEKALGQYVLYHDVLAEIEPNRCLYLAIPQTILHDVFEESVGKLLIKNNRIRIFGFDENEEVIVQWIP